MRRLLIVSPHFPPVNAPDMQRVRMSLPAFVAAGWDVTVLTVDDPTPLAPVEPELMVTIPPAVRVVRAHCASRRWTRWLGVNNVALRALPSIFITGCRLLAGLRYDVVYFSSTLFIVLPFGRIWRWLYGVPYVIDLQDPWVTDFYERPGAPPPPGGWKYRVSRRISLLLEGWTMRRASHLITVSAAYGENLRARYPDLQDLPCTELPFGSPDPDLRHLRATLAQRPTILLQGGFRLAFAGALGPGMLGAVEILFAAVSALRRDGVPVSVHFFGTSYAAGAEARPVTLALATRYGVQDCVQEQPGRLPYFSALQITLEADANLILGSTDLAFTPSKILAVQSAGRPVLVLAYAGSAMIERLKKLNLPHVTIGLSADDGPAVADTINRLRRLMSGSLAPTPLPEEFRAETLAAAQLAILAAVSPDRT